MTIKSIFWIYLGSYTYKLTEIVTAYRKPVPDQARSNTRMEKRTG